MLSSPSPRQFASDITFGPQPRLAYTHVIRCIDQVASTLGTELHDAGLLGFFSLNCSETDHAHLNPPGADGIAQPRRQPLTRPANPPQNARSTVVTAGTEPRSKETRPSLLLLYAFSLTALLLSA